MPPAEPNGTKNNSTNNSSTPPTNPSSSSSSSNSSNPSSDTTSSEAQSPESASSDEPNPDRESAIFFDWDDTLLASSFLSSRGYCFESVFNPDKPDDVEVENQLKELESCVVSLIERAIQVGHVSIITNAETGWVQLSATKFMPKVVPLLEKLHVVSARSTFEVMFPESPLKWKFFAMQERLSHLFTGRNDLEKHVMSFGDSHVEREAVRAVCRGVPNTKTKSVKFAERPSMEQLRRQLELVSQCFSYIHSHNGDLDLQLTVTLNPHPQPDQPNGESSNADSNNVMNQQRSFDSTVASSSSESPSQQEAAKALPLAVAAQQ